MRRLLPLILLLLLPSAARAQTVEDNQVWMTLEGRADLTRSLRLAVQQELRLGTEAGYDETFTDIELMLRMSRALAVAGHYRLILLDGETRHRATGDFVARLRRKPVELTYRLRLQVTSRENDDALVPLRNKLKLALTTLGDLEAYVAIELFYQLSPASEYRETRFYVGAQYQLSKKLDVEAFYLEQRETNVAAPENNHVLGLGVVYSFRDVDGKGKDKDRDKDDEGAPDADTGGD